MPSPSWDHNSIRLSTHFLSSFLSRFHVCSLPGSTPSGITPPPSTAHSSAGSARPDASPTSSWAPCTLYRGRPCPQPPATPSRHRPPPVCEVQIGRHETCLYVWYWEWLCVFDSMCSMFAVPYIYLYAPIHAKCIRIHKVDIM